MNEEQFQQLEKNWAVLKLHINRNDFAEFMNEHAFSPDAEEAMNLMFEFLGKKQIEASIATMKRLSGLPMKNPKTFDNFDFSVIHGKNADRLKSLKTLAPIYAHKNLAFIGPAGTGKTHLAQAFGFECCQQRLKTYFIKMTELRDRFLTARRNGKVATVLNSLVRPSCLIIDEVGHCEFDKENTRLFFDLIDRRYNKEGAYNTVFTSNKNPSEWRHLFHEEDALFCALDRIFDDAIIFKMNGTSFRGNAMETIRLETSRIKTPEKAKHQSR